MTTINNILIVGSGAIGLLWYSHLQTKHSVNCYLYQSPSRKKSPNAIKFFTINHESLTIPTKLLPNNNSQHIDIILICVKSYQLNQAIADIKHLIDHDTIVVTTHNGLGALNEQSLHGLKNNTVLDLLTTHGSLKTSDNKVVHTGAGFSHLGVKFNQTKQLAVKALGAEITQLLHSVMPNVIWCDDMLYKQWTKLAINCVINPLTALFDINNGEILDERFDQTINQLIDEIVAVANIKKLTLDKGTLKETVLLVGKSTAKNSSSMRCDIQNKRKTEIEYINGYIHRLGQASNIPTPKNSEFYKKVLAL